MGQRMEQTFDNIAIKIVGPRGLNLLFFPSPFEGTVLFSECLSVSTGFYRHCSDYGPPT